MHTENKKRTGAGNHPPSETGVPGCRLQPRLQRSLEASRQCPPGRTVYRCPRKHDRTEIV